MSAPHTVLSAWVRPAAGSQMVPRPELELVAGEGVVGDHTRGRKRHVTLLFADDWAAALAELGSDLDPSTRRANVLVSGGGGGGALIGRTIRLGHALVEIVAETKPCALMDEAESGLQEALRPACRGGVWGRVLEGGCVAVGSHLAIEID